MIARWAFLAFVDLLISFLAYPLAPIIVLFTDKEGNYPQWGSWWMTDDNPIDGDAGHMVRWAKAANNLGWPGVFAQRVAWLWRNRGYGFSTNVCGLTSDGTSLTHGDRLVSDNPYHEGVCKVVGGTTLPNGSYDLMWEYYAIKPIGSTRFFWRLRFGWKLPLTALPAKGERIMLVFHISLRYRTKE